MKTLVATTCAALCSSLAAPAAFLAHIDTTEGRVTAELQFDKTPLTVANFVTLVEGTRAHIDPDTGAISTSPYYIGESFYRVVDTATFKIAQTGSGTGTNSGGPGYTFRDEFDPSLRHVPYVLSMANSGPNTNGSQIFLVGNSTPSHLDDVHTIFGVVTDAPSQAVIDAIHAAGNDGSSITGITFERTDPAAVAFDEMAQGLPEILPVPGHLEVVPGQHARFVPDEPATVGDILHATSSTNLESWQQVPESHIGLGPASMPASSSRFDLDGATSPRNFYQLARARHPGAVAPSHFESRTLTLPDAGGVYEFVFDPSGTGGTVNYTPTEGSAFSSSFSLFEKTTTAHAFTLITDSPSFNPRYLLIKAGCESADATEITSRHSTQYYNSIIGWQPYASGTCTLTR